MLARLCPQDTKPQLLLYGVSHSIFINNLELRHLLECEV